MLPYWFVGAAKAALFPKPRARRRLVRLSCSRLAAIFWAIMALVSGRERGNCCGGLMTSFSMYPCPKTSPLQRARSSAAKSEAGTLAVSS